MNFDTSATAELFSKRAWKVTTKRAVDTDVKSRIEDALVAWEDYASDPESELVYTDERKSQRPKKLLRTDNLVNSTGEWLVPTSMREVEPPVCLLLDEQAIKPTRNYPWPQKLAKDGKASKD